MIGKTISDLRKKKNLTQQQLSKISGVDYNTLRKVETGKTENPTKGFLEKIANGLGIKMSQLLNEELPQIRTLSIQDVSKIINVSVEELTKNRPTIINNTFPYETLTPDQFEGLIVMLLMYDLKYSDVEHYGGIGDKNRDVIAKEIISGKRSSKYTLFQAKRHANIRYDTFKNELDSINKHFFEDPNPSTPIRDIVFCISSDVSSKIRDRVRDYAKLLNIPNPSFWFKGHSLDSRCKMYPEVIKTFFNGNITLILKDTEEIKESVKNLENVVEKIDKSVRTIKQKFASVDDSQIDTNMQKAKRYIDEGRFEDAKQILLKKYEIIDNSSDPNKKKRLLNNLGICYIKSNIQADVEKGIEYLKSALDLDPDFDQPKLNLIAHYTGKGIVDKFSDVLDYAKELYDKSPDNLEYVGTLTYSYYINNKISEAILLIKKLDKTLFAQNENLCSAIALAYHAYDNLKKAEEVIESGLKNFSNSINLNHLKGINLMLKAERKGLKQRSIDIVPYFTDLKTVEQAFECFQKAYELSLGTNWPEDHQNLMRLNIQKCYIALRRGQSELAGDFQFDKLSSEINYNLLSEDEKHASFGAIISLELQSNRNFEKAYTLFSEYSSSKPFHYKVVVDLAKKFFQYGSPEITIKMLKSVSNEARKGLNMDYWAFLSSSYALIGDKSSAIRVINEAKSDFITTDKDMYQKVLSQEGALAARYKDNSESDRLFKSMSELQAINPEGKVLVPIKAGDEEGNLSQEIKDFFANAQKDFEKKKELFLSNPMPNYWLERIFGRSFPEAIEVPQNNFDFQFYLPYNSLDESFTTGQDKIFNQNDKFVIDYSALLSFARSGQLGLLQALDKKIIASEYLLFQIQTDLITYENTYLRDAWDFLRHNNVKLFPLIDDAGKQLGKKVRDTFSPWLIQEIEYCAKNMAPLLTDDLRLMSLLKSKPYEIESINSFIFFKESLATNLIEKKEYSRAIGHLADLFYHFLPFDAEDLLNIVSDDATQTRSNTVAWAYFKDNPNMKVSRRTYFLLYQSKLPGAALNTFHGVCLAFLIKFLQLGFTVEDKLDWSLFLTNFFSDFIANRDLKSEHNAVQEDIKFLINIWVFTVKFIPKRYGDKIIEKIESIQNEDIKLSIKNLYNSLSELKESSHNNNLA